MTSPAPVGPSAVALQGAAKAVPPGLDPRFLPALTALLRSAQYPHPELGGEAGGAARVGVGLRAVDLLTRHGYTDPDLLLAALLLPWCDPACGGHRELVATRPVVQHWADAALLATVSALPRPGHDRYSYLRHVHALPPELVALVVAVRRAWIEPGPPDRDVRYDELTQGLLPLATELAAGLREEAARPLTLGGRLTRAHRRPVSPPDLAADPVTHPDLAVELALRAEPSWNRASVAVAEYDVGYVVWQVSRSGPEPGGRVAAVIVDRETRAATSWWELTAAHAAIAYQARHRLFPLLPGWRAADRGPLDGGLDTDLFPPEVRAALAPVFAQLTAQYRDALRHGGRWPELVDDWRVAVRTVSLLQVSGVTDPEVLRAGAEAPFAGDVVPAAPVGESATATLTAYVDRMRTAPREDRAVAVAYQLAAAEYAQTRFGGLCGARRADLGRMLALADDLPALRGAVASRSSTGSPGGAP